MKNLVIVESPTKARTITKFLGDEYIIKFSMGHIMDLPKSKLGIDVERDFAPQYEQLADKEKLIKELQTAAKGADAIILATDPDREGEAIAANIREVLGETKGDKRDKRAKKASDPSVSSRFQRIVFHEITEGAIKEALLSPREIDEHLVNAQTARRILDRLVGYQLSPILWRKVRRGLSAGRVQSVALRLLVEREREIEKFSKEAYFTINALLFPSRKIQNSADSVNQPIGQTDKLSSPTLPAGRQGVVKKESVEFSLIEINNKKIETKQALTLYDGDYTFSKTVIDSQEKADTIVKDLQARQFAVADVVKKQMKRSPAPPFTTSTLQQEASRRLGLSGRRTMTLAQKLYEEGYITYHRTDSVIFATSAVAQMRTFIEKQYGQKYLSGEPRVYKTKQKLAQEAHEAIRPTIAGRQPTVITQELGSQYGRLYELIWQRALASQMADAIMESTAVIVDTKIPPTTFTKGAELFDPSFIKGGAEGGGFTYRLKANGSVLIFDGFLKLNPQALQDTRLPIYEVGEQLQPQIIRADQHETLPPPRYNDASLIGTLEEKGIGRPSTYASIISTLVDRAYVERVEKRFEPTSIGKAVNDFLVTNFSTIDDIPFTAEMENELDEVASGQKEWVTMMHEFYTPFAKKLAEVGDAARVKIAVEETNEICPLCGAPLVIRHGKFGKFFSCSRFPDCKFTKPYAETTEFLCPKDGGKIIVKKTKKGRKFFGCSNYPNCDFAAWKLEDINKNAKSKEQSAKEA